MLYRTIGKNSLNNGSNDVTVIGGATNAPTTVAPGQKPSESAVNAATN
jgi:hypothetical protein